MASLAIKIRQQLQQPWIVHGDPQVLVERFDSYCDQYQDKQYIAINEGNPLSAIPALLAVVAQGKIAVLCDPHWGEHEWRQVAAQLQPDHIVGERPCWELSWHHQGPSCSSQQGYLLIPTGGTTTGIRWAWHTWTSLSRAAQAFAAHYQVTSVNACCLLPLYHISGLIQVVRTWETRGTLYFVDPLAVKQERYPTITTRPTFLSLVPTQLRRFVDQPTGWRWLKGFSHILLGGGATDDTLLHRARQASLPVFSSYGATETAAMVTAQRPCDLVVGDKSLGQPLPHVKIAIVANGSIRVQATSLFFGYYPHPPHRQRYWQSSDTGKLHADKRLYAVRRLDRVIITGGKKVDPGEVETLLRKLGWVDDVVVVPQEDEHWGHCLVAIYVRTKGPLEEAKARQQLGKHLARYKCPKRWLAVAELPFAHHGKLNHAAITKWLEQANISGSSKAAPNNSVVVGRDTSSRVSARG